MPGLLPEACLIESRINEHFQTLDDNQKRLKNDIDGIDLRALEKRLVTANSPERRAILASIEGASHDLDLLKETESTVATLRARILDNVELIESLRKRFERIRNRHDPVEELDSSFQSVATELDLELTLMEEATADIEALSTARA